MGVKLREKQLSSGQISFYLDIYHNKIRWYEFLEIHIHKNRANHYDKEKKRTKKLFLNFQIEGTFFYYF